MSAMTMAFQLQSPFLLEAVTAGDKVRFTAEKIDGKITVTNLELAR